MPRLLHNFKTLNDLIGANLKLPIWEVLFLALPRRLQRTAAPTDCEHTENWETDFRDLDMQTCFFYFMNKMYCFSSEYK